MRLRALDTDIAVQEAEQHLILSEIFHSSGKALFVEIDCGIVNWNVPR